MVNGTLKRSSDISITYLENVDQQYYRLINNDCVYKSYLDISTHSSDSYVDAKCSNFEKLECDVSQNYDFKCVISERSPTKEIRTSWRNKMDNRYTKNTTKYSPNLVIDFESSSEVLIDTQRNDGNLSENENTQTTNESDTNNDTVNKTTSRTKKKENIEDKFIFVPTGNLPINYFVILNKKYFGLFHSEQET